MKPATDPRKALILSCLALAGIALSIKVTLRSSEIAPIQPPQRDAVADLVLDPLRVDAFSHPRLSRAPVQPENRVEIVRRYYPLPPRERSVSHAQTRIAVKAILRVGQRVAYISVDGQDAIGCHAGDVLKNGLVVTAVNDDSVVVRSRRSHVTLAVGQQGDL